MTDNPEEKGRKRNLRNVSNNINKDDTNNQTELNQNTNQVNELKDDNINIHDVNPNLNQQINNAPSPNPIPYSNETISNKNPGPINNNPNMNNLNQYQQIQVQNPYLANNQIFPQSENNRVIIIQNVVPQPLMPLIITTRRYTPIRVFCPYCRTIVTTNPITSWSCRSCTTCFEACLCMTFTLCLFLFLYLCCIFCDNASFFCCEADHLCPNCKNLIAQRKIDKICR